MLFKYLSDRCVQPAASLTNTYLLLINTHPWLHANDSGAEVGGFTVRLTEGSYWVHSQPIVRLYNWPILGWVNLNPANQILEKVGS